MKEGSHGCNRAPLGISQSKVRRLFDERILLATRVDGVLKVPSDFIVDGEPLGHEAAADALGEDDLVLDHQDPHPGSLAPLTP